MSYKRERNNKKENNYIQRGHADTKSIVWKRERLDIQVHEVIRVYVSDSQMYGERGMWENVFGYS